MISFEKPSEFNPRFEVVGCFLEHDGKILVLERQDHKPQGGQWGIPAGKIEGGESSTTTMIRELNEETRFLANREDLVFLKKMFVKYPDYDFIFDLYRLSLEQAPTVSVDEGQHKSFRWVTPKDVLKMNLIEGFDTCLKVAYGA